MPIQDSLASKGDQHYGFLFAWLKAHCRSGRDVQAHAIGSAAIKVQRRVDLEKMKVAAHLHGSVSGVFHPDSRRGASGIGFNVARRIIQEIFSRLHQYLPSSRGWGRESSPAWYRLGRSLPPALPESS